MVSRRTKERIRDIGKVLKSSWKMFSESITGLVGLGIILFFVVIAALAPVLAPYDPMHWVAPYSDILEGNLSNSTGNAFNGTLIAGPTNAPLSIGTYRAYLLTQTGTNGSIVGVSLANISKNWSKNIEGEPCKNFVVVHYLNSFNSKEPSHTVIIVGANTEAGGKLYIFAENFTEELKEVYVKTYPTDRYLDKISAISFPWNSYIKPTDTKYLPPYPFFVVSETGKIYGLTLNISGGNQSSPLYISIEQKSEYQLPSGNLTIYGKPLQFNYSRNILVLTHEKGITFLKYNSSLNLSPIENYSFIPSPFCSPLTLGGYVGGPPPDWRPDNNTPVFAAGSDGAIYLFNLSSEGIRNPKNFTAVNQNEKIVGLDIGSAISSATGIGQEYQVFAVSENGKFVAFLYNPSNKTLNEVYSWDFKAKVVEPLSYQTMSGFGRVFIVTEREGGGRTLWVLHDYEYYEKYGVIRYGFETGKNLSAPFSTGTTQQFQVPFFNETSGKMDTKNETAILILLCDRNTNSIVTVYEKVRTPLPPGTYPSGNTYWLGTDTQGRDILSRLIWGTQIALFIGITAAVLSILLGTVIGLVSGYYGGTIDLVLMRITDVFLVIPFLPLVIILAAVLGSSIMNIIYVLVLIGWPGVARVIRSMILSLKERPFIDAARVTGASNFRIMFKHLFPNVVPMAVLYMTFSVSGAILTEAALSFIGLGDPNSVSWGMILHDAQYSNAVGNWWMTIPAGLCITMISMGFYLVGRAVEQIINPRLRSR